MAIEHPNEQPQRRGGFGWGALGIAAIIGVGILYIGQAILPRSFFKDSLLERAYKGITRTSEQAPKEIYLGQEQGAKYKRAEGEVLLTFYGIKGLNNNRPNEVLTAGADNNNDGFPDNIGRLVVTDLNGNEISTQAMADRIKGNLDGVAFQVVPVYTQVKDP